MASHFKTVGFLLSLATLLLFVSVDSYAQDLLPPNASTVADSIDGIFWLIFWITLFFFVLVFVVLIYFMIKYRAKKPGEEGVNFHGHVGLEIAWTIVPAVIFVVIAVLSGVVLDDLIDNVPEDALVIGVEGLQFGWNFTYPANNDDGFIQSTNILHIPANEPVLFEISSRDVLHSFWVPAFRLKQDALPNEIRPLWIEATQTGEFPIICAELCGIGHSDMLGKVVVHTRENYDAWVQGIIDEQAGLDPAVARGQALAQSNGCMACHSVDGTRLVGPTWLNLYGTTRDLADGTQVLADDEYLIRSIREPNAEIVATYIAAMPAYGPDQISDEEVQDIIAYIKSLTE